MRRAKYGNKKTVCAAGHRHDSKKEAGRCDALHLLQRAGKIRELRCQVPYHLTINGVKIGKYVADFAYYEHCLEEASSENALLVSREIIEDVKGFRHPVYKIKKKLMKAIHNVDVRET